MKNLIDHHPMFMTWSLFAIVLIAGTVVVWDRFSAFLSLRKWSHLDWCPDCQEREMRACWYWIAVIVVLVGFVLYSSISITKIERRQLSAPPPVRVDRNEEQWERERERMDRQNAPSDLAAPGGGIRGYDF